MLQVAVVKRILSADVVEVSLLRQTECGLNCTSCAGCSQKTKQELLALADNRVGAAVGDVVSVRPNHGGAASAALLVWLLPCVGLIGGYGVAGLLALSQGTCILAAFAGLVLGFLPAVFFNRAVGNQNQPEFTIVSRGR